MFDTFHNVVFINGVNKTSEVKELSFDDNGELVRSKVTAKASGHHPARLYSRRHRQVGSSGTIPE